MNLISEILLALALGGAAAAGWVTIRLIIILLSPEKLEKIKRQYRETSDSANHRPA